MLTLMILMQWHWRQWRCHADDLYRLHQIWNSSYQMTAAFVSDNASNDAGVVKPATVLILTQWCWTSQRNQGNYLWWSQIKIRYIVINWEPFLFQVQWCHSSNAWYSAGTLTVWSWHQRRCQVSCLHG